MNAALLLAALSFSLTPTAGSEKEFSDALALVDKTMGPGRWARAKEMLLEALAANKDQQYVFYRALEVQDAMQSCVFWLTHDAPEPKDCVSGELLSYSASKGQIEIRYRNEPNGRAPASKLVGKSRTQQERPPRFTGYDFSDFRKSGKLIFHPMLFDGTCTLEIYGQGSLARGGDPPLVFLCLDWGQAYAVAFTGSGGGSNVVVSILRLENGEAERLAMSDPVWATPDHELKIVVTTSSITVYLNGTKMVTAKKSTDEWGMFGFTEALGTRRVTIRGDIQTSFVQGAIDAAMQKDRAEFDNQYAPAAHLPAWFVDKTAARVEPAPGPTDVLPGKVDAQQEEHAQRYKKLLEKSPLLRKDVEEELARVQALKPEEITEELRCWLAALLLNLLDRDEEALDSCKKVRELDPKYVPARVLHLRVRGALGQRDEALQECRELVQSEPQRAEGYENLATLLLVDGKPAEARATVRTAIDAGVPADELEGIARTLMRASDGPTWSRRYTYKSEHYDVSSDISQQVCFRAATLLEKFYQKFNVHLKRIASSEKRRFPVFLFAGEAGYQAYTKELLGSEIENTGGLYSPVVKQLLIWNLPEIEEMLRTVRHEGFHQYFDQMVQHQPPKWLNEGLAQYYEGSQLVNGAWSDGELLPARVSTLRSTKLAPLQSFLSMHPSSFMDEDRVSLNYAQSWAFVHFLLNSKPEHKRRFDALLDALVKGAEADAAMKAAFGDADYARLDAEFAQYVKSKLL